MNNVASTASRSRFNIIRQKTLPGTDSRVIPRQLLQSLMSPFFGSLITAFLQSSGTHFSFQELFMRLVNAPIVLGPPCFSNSADISSSAAALLSFSALIALSVSSSVRNAVTVIKIHTVVMLNNKSS